MLSLSLPLDVYLCVPSADMRRSFDGLIRMAEEHLGRDPLRGGLYVFLNKRRDRVKLLYFDTDGPAIWYKKHEEDYLQWFIFTEIGGWSYNLVGWSATAG